MKKIIIPVFVVLAVFFLAGCSNSDKQLIKDTVALFDETTPPQLSLVTDIPTSTKMGEKFNPHFTITNTGGGMIKVYVNMYKNEEALIKYGAGMSMVTRHGATTANLQAFDFVNNATYETANANVKNNYEGFTSPGIYKYEFVFYNCADLKSKLSAGDNCNWFSVDQKYQSEFSAKGVEPIKVESYQVIVN